MRGSRSRGPRLNGPRVVLRPFSARAMKSAIWGRGGPAIICICICLYMYVCVCAYSCVYAWARPIDKAGFACTGQVCSPCSKPSAEACRLVCLWPESR